MTPEEFHRELQAVIIAKGASYHAYRCHLDKQSKEIWLYSTGGSWCVISFTEKDDKHLPFIMGEGVRPPESSAPSDFFMDLQIADEAIESSRIEFLTETEIKRMNLDLPLAHWKDPFDQVIERIIFEYATDKKHRCQFCKRGYVFVQHKSYKLTKTCIKCNKVNRK